MPISSGTRLGAYEILSPLGAGGMGEVYCARDTRLNREVAIKVLPSAWSADPDRLARFEQEARAAATLNHPNILAVHDLGFDGSTTYLVTELLEGETLRETIAGPLPVKKTIDYAIQIANGLAAAHEKGIVHRDLKPENLFITNSGRLKILDFGLAKLSQPESGAAGVSVMATVPGATQPGVVLGTVGYMSPEQVRGLPADHRSDLFALGAVLYEMLSGRSAFRRETGAETMTAILKEDAPELSSADRQVPLGLERIVARCLDKNPASRFQSASDLAFAFEALTASRSGATAAVSAAAPVARRERIAWTLALLSLAVALATLVISSVRRGGADADAPEMRLQIVAPATDDPASFALSPDGRRLVFSASFDGKTQLWLRAIDNVAAQPLAGTDGGVNPFWSPDSQSIAFVAAGRLKRLDLSGGLVRTLPAATSGYGGAWAQDGTILYANSSASPLLRVPAAGGDPVPVTRLDVPRQLAHRFPQFLPDGRHFIYFVSGNPEGRGIYVASLDAPQNGRRLFATDGAAIYLTGGFLLFARQGTLVAQRFDAATLTLSGDQIPIAEQVAFDPFVYKAGVSASNVGTFVYRAGAGTGLRMLAWIDRTGRTVEAVGGTDASALSNVELSPDGTRIAIDRTVNGNTDVWVIDTARKLQTRFTFDPAVDRNAIWSADGQTIAFLSTRRGPLDLWEKPSSGAGAEQLLVSSNFSKLAEDFSSDGRFLLYRVNDPQTGRDIWALPLTGKREPFAVRRTEFEERESQFSPDVKWIAYVSNQSGPFEVYVQPFPGPGGTWQVSTMGGVQPRWRRDGKEIFYIAPDGRMMAVPITKSADSQALQPGTPVPLFQTRVAGGTAPGSVKHQYAVSADGQRFLVNQSTEQASAVPITLVLNWTGAKSTRTK